MKPTQGGRPWFKLWANEWLDGTTRFQMSDAQRAFWIDLLALAGRSRHGGVVCSGKDGNKWVGYPLSRFQGLLSEPMDIPATFELFRKTGKITIQLDGQGPTQLYTLFITKWAKYQSEYERTKQYRKPENTEKLHGKSLSRYEKSTPQKQRKKQISDLEEQKTEYTAEAEDASPAPMAHPAAAAADSTVIEAFNLLSNRPFGPKAFQQIWTRTAQSKTDSESWSDTMERCIENCEAAGVKIPSKFYKIKRKAESAEVDNLFR